MHGKGVQNRQVRLSLNTVLTEMRGGHRVRYRQAGSTEEVNSKVRTQ